MYVTPRKAVDYLLAGKVHDVVGITGNPRILILDGLTPFGASVECRVSLSSGELRSAQLGSSGWGVLWWIIRYFISDLLLAASWLFHARLTHTREQA